MSVCLCSTDAVLPSRGSKVAAGWDLYSSENLLIKAKERGICSTGIKIVAPEGTYARIAPRSGLTLKHGLDVGAGVIDADYRGEIKIVLFNHSSVDYHIEKGDRVAQLIFEKIDTTPLKMVPFVDETERGESGFGSTGGTTSVYDSFDSCIDPVREFGGFS